jgi:chemotaxis protein histidine kinase CheA
VGVVKDLGAELDADWHYVADFHDKDSEGRLSADAFTDHFVSKYGHEVSDHESYKSFLKDVFDAAVDMKFPLTSLDNTLDENRFRYAAIMAGEFDFDEGAYDALDLALKDGDDDDEEESEAGDDDDKDKEEEAAGDDDDEEKSEGEKAEVHAVHKAAKKAERKADHARDSTDAFLRDSQAPAAAEKAEIHAVHKDAKKAERKADQARDSTDAFLRDSQAPAATEKAEIHAVHKAAKKAERKADQARDSMDAFLRDSQAASTKAGSEPEAEKEEATTSEPESEPEAKPEEEQETKDEEGVTSIREQACIGDCWEADTSQYPACTGYVSAGYVCAGNMCAACNPGGTPVQCATPAVLGTSPNPATGRCEKAAIDRAADGELSPPYGIGRFGRYGALRDNARGRVFSPALDPFRPLDDYLIRDDMLRWKAFMERA